VAGVARGCVVAACVGADEELLKGDRLGAQEALAVALEQRSEILVADRRGRPGPASGRDASSRRAGAG